MKNFKTYIQNIHYNKQKANFLLYSVLFVSEFFYKSIINSKNFLYKKSILKEEKINAHTVCIGNLTTGGVGKTPIVTELANKISKHDKVAVISRGYGSKIKTKEPIIIKDFEGLKFKDGSLCADEPFQIAKDTDNNVVVITSPNRKKACNIAIEKYSCKVIIFDDGFSNRKIQKDKNIIVIDSKMRFGNSHLLPLGPLREPLSEIKRADEIILVNKGDENIANSIDWAKSFNKPIKVAGMIPSRVYNIQTKANVIFKSEKQKAIAFCAIGQAGQFFNFAQNYYNLIQKIAFNDHHRYTKKDIRNLIKNAKKEGVTVFVTTKKDEVKLTSLIQEYSGYCFNALELKVEIQTI